MSISPNLDRRRMVRLLLVGCSVVVVAACNDPPQEAETTKSTHTPAALAVEVEAIEPDLDVGRLVNIAGRQRMLTQRIVKSYLQILLGVEPAGSDEQRQASIDQFEQQLTELESHTVSKAVSTALEKVHRLWPGFKAAASTTVSLDSAARLHSEADTLLFACESVVAALVDASPDILAELVNVSGRQRMLSQRFSMLYMLEAAGLNSQSTRVELGRVRNEFEGALQWLGDAQDNTPASREILAEIADMWLWLDGALQIKSEKHYPWIVASVSEKTLSAAEDLTELYTRGSHRLKKRTSTR